MTKRRATLDVVFLMLCVAGGLVSTLTVLSTFYIAYQTSPFEFLQPNIPQLGNGFGTDYLISPANQSLPIEAILANWQSEVPMIKSFGFNTVRLAFAFNNSGGTADSVLVYSKLDQVLKLLDQNGLLAILDLHNFNDMPGFFGSPDWVQSWVDLASHYKNDQIIVAYELFNEPSTTNWYSTVQTGGASGPAGIDCLKALAQCVDAIRATGDNHAIVYPDPYFIIPYSQRLNPNYIPQSLRRSNIIMTFHCWYGDTQTVTKMKTDLAALEDEIATWQKSYPVWIGEYGWYTGSQYNQTLQQTWLVDLTQWAFQHGIKVNWYLHGYVGGRTEGYQLCQTVMQAVAMPNQRTKNYFSSIYDNLICMSSNH